VSTTLPPVKALGIVSRYAVSGVFGTRDSAPAPAAWRGSFPPHQVQHEAVLHHSICGCECGRRVLEDPGPFGREDLHLVSVMLNVADILPDGTLEAVVLRKLLLQSQLAFSGAQALSERAANAAFRRAGRPCTKQALRLSYKLLILQIWALEGLGHLLREPRTAIRREAGLHGSLGQGSEFPM
jgi:hypothetical protein